jgi:hypothetical protein
MSSQELLGPNSCGVLLTNQNSHVHSWQEEGQKQKTPNPECDMESRQLTHRRSA